jgi:hypothetical protein
MSTVFLHDFADNPEAEAGVGRFLGGDERLKYASTRYGVPARAIN